jgi:tetratricopeptide (TPR) repeat protein
MNIGYVFLVVMVGMAYFVSGVPTPDEMIAEFSAAQKFYTSKAYDQALEKYDQVGKMESRFLDEDKVVFEVGNMRSPVKDLCLYQSGNAYFQMARDQKDFEARAKTDEDKEKAKKLKQEFIQKANDFFVQTQERTKNLDLRPQAQNRVVETWYMNNDYDRVIKEGEILIQKYPNSSYVLNAMYNIGWAYYDTKRYDQSIDAFKKLLERFPGGNMPDRALFQIGEAYFDQKKFAEAIPYYQQLVDKMRINEMTDQEIQKMQRQKLSGLVDQTALDLAAQAQLKVGACYADQKMYKEAEVAYKRIATMFRFDQTLISKAYQELADMYLASGNFDASIKAYRDAIDEVPDKIFSAKMQVLIAQRYFEYFYYDKAVTEFNNYINNYSDVALRAGFDVDKGLYYLGRSYYEQGVQLLAKKETQAGQDNILQSTTTYEKLMKQFPDTDLKQNVYYNLALSYQKSGTPEMLQKSIDLYTQLLKEFPDSPNRKYCYYQIGAAYLDLKKYDEAIAFYNKIISEFPDDPSVDNAWFQMARAYKDSGREMEAIAPFLKISKKGSKQLFTTARLFSAQTYLKESKFQEALDVMKVAVEDTSAIDSPKNLSRIYIMMGSAAKSLAEQKKDDQLLKESVDYYTKAIEINDPDTREQASVYRAGNLISLNQFAQAESDLRKLMESPNPQIKRDAQMRLAMISVKQNKSSQAIDTYLGLYNSTQDPNEKIEFLRSIIQISALANDTNSLVKYSNMMIESPLAEGKKPTNSQAFYKEEAYFYLADTFEKQGDLKKAIDYYLQGYQKFPNSYFSSDMLLKVGVIYLTKLNTEPNALDTAAEYFDKYIKAFPDTPMTTMAHYYLGFCYYNGRRFTEAAQTFRSFAEKYPNSEFTPEALFYCGDCNYNLGNQEEAVKWFNMVITRYPSHEKAEEALFTKAWALLDLQREEEGMNTLRQLVDKYPKGKFAAVALFSVADYYYNTQKYEEALNTYQEVLKNYPDSDVAKKIPDTINELSETVAYLDYEKAFTLFSQAKEKADLNLYRQSAELFEAILKKFPGTESETGSLANLGVAYEEIGEFQKAVNVYDRLMKKYESAGGNVSLDAFNFARAHRAYIMTNKL